MTFQPFGYPFDINSPLSPDKLREAIRSRRKGWFDTKNGARGWVIGPLICLWWSAFDRNGPMLLGWISRNTWGTRISGRAGSDLNGVLLQLALMPVMTFLIYILASSGGDKSFVPVGIIGGIWTLIFVIVLWLKHMFRREAEPLVRFLENAATKSRSHGQPRPAAGANFLELVLTVNDEDHPGYVTPDTLHDALLRIGPGEFAVLSSAPETYLQTAWQDGGFIIEMRDGDEARHFRAARSEQPPLSKDGSRVTFTFEEVLAVFIAYTSGTPAPALVAWETMR